MTTPGATLAQIDAALFAALSALQCPPNGIVDDARPFALVERHAGALGERELNFYAAQFPLALLAFDTETSTRFDVLLGDGDDRGAAEWVVYVAVKDPRGVAEGVVGQTGVPGALTLSGLVTEVLNQLVIDGLWRSRRVRYAGTRPHLVKLGEMFVYAVRFEAQRDAEFAAEGGTAVTANATTLLGVRGSVNLLEQPDPAANPLLVFDADTTS
jgi:hypothetical protein